MRLSVVSAGQNADLTPAVSLAAGYRGGNRSVQLLRKGKGRTGLGSDFARFP